VHECTYQYTIYYIRSTCRIYIVLSHLCIYSNIYISFVYIYILERGREREILWRLRTLILRIAPRNQDAQLLRLGLHAYVYVYVITYTNILWFLLVDSVIFTYSKSNINHRTHFAAIRYMYICIQMYMYICKYIYINVYIFINRCLYIYTYIYIYICTYIYILISYRTHEHRCTSYCCSISMYRPYLIDDNDCHITTMPKLFKHTHAHTQTQTHKYKQTRTHTHTHTHIHIHTGGSCDGTAEKSCTTDYTCDGGTCKVSPGYLHLYIWMCICVYAIYTHIYGYRYRYIYVYIYTHTYIYICLYMFLYMYKQIHIYVFTCMYVYTHLCACAWAGVCVYALTCVYKCTYKYTIYYITYTYSIHIVLSQ
jgi:hypothetical protein